MGKTEEKTSMKNKIRRKPVSTKKMHLNPLSRTSGLPTLLDNILTAK